MGKASSSKKVARAARAAGRPGAKKSYVWPGAIALVVLAGVGLILLSFGGSDTATGAPRANTDHWHAAYGIYDCDHFLGALNDAAEDTSGIHTHGEGLMHIHPFFSRYAGTNANVGAFMTDTGSKLSDTSFTGAGTTLKNGNKCGSKTGTLELVTWSSPTDKTPTVITKDLAKYAPKDQSVWVLAFVASGTDVPLPPAAANLADPLAAEEGRQPVHTGDQTTTTIGGTTTSTEPAGATTTIPAGDSTTTSTP
jgi:hypothetical protein